MRSLPACCAFLLAAAPAAASAATAAERASAILGAMIFFGGLFALLAAAIVLRIRDAREGLDAAAKQARMQRRLPWFVGGLVGLVACVLVMF